MESSVDSYLHKKFKKQLSTNNNNKENNKDEQLQQPHKILEQNQEKKPVSVENSDQIVEPNQPSPLPFTTDNITTVPNSSTKNIININVKSESSLGIVGQNVNNNNNSKSSISNPVVTTSTLQSLNISYVPNNNTNTSIQRYDVVSFDNSNLTNVGQKSSILDNANLLYNSTNSNENTTNSNAPVENSYYNCNIKTEDIQQTVLLPDKSSGVGGGGNHSSGGKYICNYCNLACSKPSVLQKHIRAHTNERPYPCVSCGFSFKTRSNLYKHCRSRTHANRVLGSKARGELNLVGDEHPHLQEYEASLKLEISEPSLQHENQKSKLYKPRFHTTYEQQIAKENINSDNSEENSNSLKSNNLNINHKSDILSHHINELINKKNSNSTIQHSETYLKKEESSSLRCNNLVLDEPLNLTSKGRKRCISEAVESKSLIKELLLQNLSSDMQCPHCKMIFQTVTELELHKLRSCKGFIQPGAKYTRSSSVNVASILTQNKNAFDNIPQMQAVFPLKSPGPFLGKTRLVEGDKYSKSFSFDETLPNVSKYLLSPMEKKTPPIKLFGGEVKISENSDSANQNCTKKTEFENENFLNYSGKISENRVIKSSLHSGGTVVTNTKDVKTTQNVIVYDSTSSTMLKNHKKKPPDLILHSMNNEPSNSANSAAPSPYKYTNIIDFSQNAVKLLTPNLKQPNLMVPGLTVPNKFTYSSTPTPTATPENFNFNSNLNLNLSLTNPLKIEVENNMMDNPNRNLKNESLYNPMNLLVDGKIVRYVPGMPGPIMDETPSDPPPIEYTTTAPTPSSSNEPKKIQQQTHSEMRSPSVIKLSPKKFARPNSLALKPTPASLKQHHGLTPTMFNQILISPDTPRVAKKYVQQYLNGNYFSYLGLKSSTKPTYCTLNKTQPFYVPHFKKLSMYSEWRQQDTKVDKLYVGGYDSRQRNSRYSIATNKECELILHPSYQSNSLDSSKDKDESQKLPNIQGGYECNDDYTYIRGRGRGRYVCEQCGIRCKKPSMLKKHIRTHSNDRPYTCSHCNFSFKTKGNLTKHLKSKAHNKNSNASSSCSSTSTQQSVTESDTDDSGMDSSDESSTTRQQEHEAAYGLLSLSQKHQITAPIITSHEHHFQIHESKIMNNEEIAYVSKTNYAKNKFLEQPSVLKFNELKELTATSSENLENRMNQNETQHFMPSRPLTYPYVMSEYDDPISISSDTDISTKFDNQTPESTEFKCIKKFHVIQRYISEKEQHKENNERSVIVTQNIRSKPSPLMYKRKLNIEDAENDDEAETSSKLPKNNDEVIDLSVKNGFETARNTNTNLSSSPQEIVKFKESDVGTIRSNGIILNHNQDSNNTNDFDNSAMETLAEIATKQVKIEKNAMAKSVASEYLKLATKQEFVGETERLQAKDVNDLLVKPEGNKSCTICSKNFSKPSQLRLHMNVHYLERPFRCESCSVSFRTKGHLQKHERSAGHHNKLSTSPALSSSEPRPFKCADCEIAFRIHGHLAKHLRSKLHIMKLECLAKIPFGLYAELERSNSLLTEINTTDGDQCLESLRALAKKVLSSDASKQQGGISRC